MSIEEENVNHVDLYFGQKKQKYRKRNSVKINFKTF